MYQGIGLSPDTGRQPLSSCKGVMRIVFTTFGSLGDLHPYLAIAIEMKRRGHEVVIASSNLYREKVESEGIRFVPVRPDLENFADRSEMVAKVMHAHRGPEFLFREMLMPALRDSFQDVVAAAEGADLLVSHIAMFATPIVAELFEEAMGIDRIAAGNFLFSDRSSLLSAVRTSPPNVAGGRARYFRDGAGHHRAVAAAGSDVTGGSGPAASRSPVFDDQFSPWGTLACFSPLLAASQPDWSG